MRKLSKPIVEKLISSNYELDSLSPLYIYKRIAFLELPCEILENMTQEFRNGIFEHHIEFSHSDIFKRSMEGNFYLSDFEYECQVGKEEYNQYLQDKAARKTHLSKCFHSDINRDLDIRVKKVITIEDIFIPDDNKLLQKLDKMEEKKYLHCCVDPADASYCYEVDIGLKMHRALFVNKEGNPKHSITQQMEIWLKANAPEILKSNAAFLRVTTSFNPHTLERYKKLPHPEKSR